MGHTADADAYRLDRDDMLEKYRDGGGGMGGTIMQL